MKKLILILAILFVIVVGGLIAAIVLVDKELIKDKVAEQVEKATGKPLVIKDTPSLSIIPLGISMGNVSWGKKTSDGKADDLFVSVESAKVQIALFPLFSGKIIIEEIMLDTPSVSMVEKKTGDKKESKASSAADSEKAEAGLDKFELSRLSIKNGSVLYDDGAGQVIDLKKFSMSVNNVKSGEETSLKLESDISLLSPELKGRFEVSGKTILQGSSIIDVHPLTIKFTPSKGVVPTEAGPITVNLEGAYDLNAGKLAIRMLQLALNSLKLNVSGDLEAAKTIAFKGNISLDTVPSKAAQAFGITLSGKGFDPFKFETPVSYAGDLLTLGNIKSKLHDTSINGNFSLKTGQVSDLKVKLEIDSVNLDDYLPGDSDKTSEKTAGGASASQTSSEKDKSGGKTVYPSLDADLLIKSLIANKIELKDVIVKVKGSNGNYRINPFDFVIGTGGKFTSNSVADLIGMKHKVTATLSDLALASLMKAMSGKSSVDGKADSHIDLTFSGLDAKAIQSSLSGTGNVSAKDVKMLDPSVILSKVPVIKDPLNDIYHLAVPFNATDGIVNLSKIDLTSEADSVNAKGQGIVDLKQEKIDVTADLKFAMMTFPLHISGPFTDISYGVDAGKLIENIITSPVNIIGAGMQAIEKIVTPGKEDVKDEEGAKGEEGRKDKEGVSIKESLKEIFKKQ